MNSIKKIILTIFLTLLFINITYIPFTNSEINVIKNEKSNLARKHIIFITGNGLKEIKYNEYCFNGPLDFFYRFYGFNGSYVRLFFNNTETVFMIKDGIPRNIQGPVYLEFGLSEPSTFAFLFWPREGKSYALGYCLYIVINQPTVI